MHDVTFQRFNTSTIQLAKTFGVALRKGGFRFSGFQYFQEMQRFTDLTIQRAATLQL